MKRKALLDDPTAEEVSLALHKAERARRTIERVRGRKRKLTKAERRRLNTARVTASQLRKLLMYLQSHRRLTYRTQRYYLPSANIAGQMVKNTAIGFVPNDDPRLFRFEGETVWMSTQLGKRQVWIRVDQPVWKLLQRTLSEWEFITVVARSNGRSWDQLAAWTGKSPSTFQTYMRRARDKVARLVSESGELQDAVRAAAAAYPHLDRTRRLFEQ